MKEEEEEEEEGHIELKRENSCMEETYPSKKKKKNLIYKENKVSIKKETNPSHQNLQVVDLHLCSNIKHTHNNITYHH